MPKRKEPELDPKEQFKRFKETAKELEVDEAQDHLKVAIQKLAHGKTKQDRSSRS